MAYLSVPSPGKWIFDIFGKNMFWQFLGILEPGIPTCLDPRRAGVGLATASQVALKRNQTGNANWSALTTDYKCTKYGPAQLEKSDPIRRQPQTWEI